MSITYLATTPSAPPIGGGSVALDLTWSVLFLGTVGIAAVAASAARELVAGPRPALAVRHLMGVVFIVVPATITVAWVSGGVAVLVCLIVPPTTYVIAAFAGASEHTSSPAPTRTPRPAAVWPVAAQPQAPPPAVQPRRPPVAVAHPIRPQAAPLPSAVAVPSPRTPRPQPKRNDNHGYSRHPHHRPHRGAGL